MFFSDNENCSFTHKYVCAEQSRVYHLILLPLLQCFLIHLLNIYDVPGSVLGLGTEK